MDAMSDVLALLRQASRDAALEARDVRVLVVVSDLLDIWQYRPLKAVQVSRAATIHEDASSAILSRLVTRGYLARGCDDPLAPREAQSRRPHWFRLFLTRCDVRRVS
jgi:hypothetical protein